MPAAPTRGTSPNGRNGFWLGQAFLNARGSPVLEAVDYVWGVAGNGHRRRHALSDHAALVVDLADG